MPKTSNLRSELLNIQQAGDQVFTVAVVVWEAPGNKNSPHAVRFLFVTHKNPALWWRLSMTAARQMGGAGRPARYTNAQYNKALRTATDALNAFLTRESDERAAKALAPNLSRMPSLRYGTMPNEVAFLMSVSDRFHSPFVFNMRLTADDEATVVRAAELCDAQIHRPDARTLSITSPRDMYKIIQSLQLMATAEEFGDERAGDIAATLMGMAGFNWTDSDDF
jgi:hypothetical protein